MKIVTQIICFLTSKDGNNIDLIVDPTLIFHPRTNLLLFKHNIIVSFVFNVAIFFNITVVQSVF
jgi:hypothetical protein